MAMLAAHLPLRFGADLQVTRSSAARMQQCKSDHLPPPVPSSKGVKRWTLIGEIRGDGRESNTRTFFEDEYDRRRSSRRYPRRKSRERLARPFTVAGAQLLHLQGKARDHCVPQQGGGDARAARGSSTVAFHVVDAGCRRRACGDLAPSLQGDIRHGLTRVAA